MNKYLLQKTYKKGGKIRIKKPPRVMDYFYDEILEIEFVDFYYPSLLGPHKPLVRIFATNGTIWFLEEIELL